MTQRDPFEEYKRRREVELMEHEFQEKSASKRELIEELLNESGAIEELEERVTDEMQEFLEDSTRTAERMLEQIHEEEGATGQANQELKQELESFIATTQAPAPPPPPAPNEPALAEAPASEAPPAPPPAEAPPPALDLRAALAKIRGDEPPRPSVDGAPPGARSREEILESFDATYQQVSSLLNRKLDEPAGEAPRKLPSLEETSRRDSPAGPTAAAPPAPAAPPLTDPFAGGEGGGMASTNAFAAEPHEDRDLDDVPEEPPQGWDIPVRKPPPGAWVVAKQKEEGEAGLAGMAGDTYLLKKLSQEVRRLNRVYLVLLEKKLVTREEVEGPGADGNRINIDSGEAPKSSENDDDDDVVGVDDYDEDRYRPILTNEKDFSLSTLVKDVHRLKTLQTVLHKKGIVTEKEMAKVKG